MVHSQSFFQQRHRQFKHFYVNIDIVVINFSLQNFPSHFFSNGIKPKKIFTREDLYMFGGFREQKIKQTRGIEKNWRNIS